MLKNPAHPGEIIEDAVLPSFGLNVTEAAKVLHITRANLTRVLKGKAALTPELALKLEKAFGVDAKLMVSVQAQYDLAQSRLRQEEITRDVERQTAAA